MKLIFDALSCWVLYDAFRRINAFSTQGKLLIDTKMVRTHMICYSVFILSQLLFYAANLGDISWYFTLTTLLFLAAGALSQLLLMKIFNTICETEATRNQEQSKLRKQRVESVQQSSSSDEEEGEAP